MIDFACPNCGMTLKLADDKAGKKGKCPKCGNVSIVPQPPPKEIVARVVDESPAAQLAAQVAAPVYARPVQTAQSQRVNVYVNAPKGTSGLGIAALVLGIIACLGCWIPFLNVVSIILAVLGILFGFIGFLISAIGRRSGVGMPVAGLIVCIVAIVFSVAVTGGTAAAIDETLSDASKRRPTLTPGSGSNTATNAPTVTPTPKAPPPKSETMIAVAYSGKKPADFGTSLQFALTNNSGKDIQSFVGAIRIFDQFGEKADHFTLKIQQDDPVANGATVNQSGVWPLVSDRTIKLLENGQAKLEFVVDQVIYADGTREKFD